MTRSKLILVKLDNNKLVWKTINDWKQTNLGQIRQRHVRLAK